MTNMLQFSNEMDDTSFVETSSIFNETDILMNISICKENVDLVRTLFNQTLPLWRHQGLHSSQNLDFHANSFTLQDLLDIKGQ